MTSTEALLLIELINLNLLNNSYEKNKNNKVRNFEIDQELSNNLSQVYKDPTTGRSVIAHTGSNNLSDWGSNIKYALGFTPTFDKRKEIQEKAYKKYGDKLITVGHSRGALAAQNLAKPNTEVYTLDKPTNLVDTFKSLDNPNQVDIRHKKDLVSFLTPYQKRKGKLLTINTSEKGILNSHKISQLDHLRHRLLGSGNWFKPARTHDQTPQQLLLKKNILKNLKEVIYENYEDPDQCYEGVLLTIITDLIEQYNIEVAYEYGESINDIEDNIKYCYTLTPEKLQDVANFLIQDSSPVLLNTVQIPITASVQYEPITDIDDIQWQRDDIETGKGLRRRRRNHFKGSGNNIVVPQQENKILILQRFFTIGDNFRRNTLTGPHIDQLRTALTRYFVDHGIIFLSWGMRHLSLNQFINTVSTFNITARHLQHLCNDILEEGWEDCPLVDVLPPIQTDAHLANNEFDNVMFG